MRGYVGRSARPNLRQGASPNVKKITLPSMGRGKREERKKKKEYSKQTMLKKEYAKKKK